MNCPLKKISNPRNDLPCDRQCALFVRIEGADTPDLGMCGLSAIARTAIARDVELRPNHRLVVNA